MATINPYASGDVITFPAKTPAGVINAYYAAILRNQQLAAAVKNTSRWDPWIETLENFQKQVLNPYINLWLKEPFEDYRKTYDTNEVMRQQAGQITAQTEAAKQVLADKYAQEQIEQQDLGGSIGGLLTQMQPQTTSTDTGVTEPYGAYEDPWVTPPGPTFPNYNPYAGSVAPEAVAVEPSQPPMAASWQQQYEAEPAALPPEAVTPPSRDAWARDPMFQVPGPPSLPPPTNYVGKPVRNQETGQEFVWDGGTWTNVATPAERQAQATPSWQQDYEAGPPPMPPEAPVAAPPVTPTITTPVAAPAPAAAPPDVGVIPPATGGRSRFMSTSTTSPSLAEAMRLLAAIDPTQAGMMTQALQKNENLAGIIDPQRQSLNEAKVLEILARTGLTGAKTRSETELLDPRVAAILAKTRETESKSSALEMRTSLLSDAYGDYTEGRIGKEELAIRVAAIHGKTAGGGGAGAQTDTKTFLTALTSVRIDPKNAGKSDSELRELAAQWIQDQAQDIEDRKAYGRARGEARAGVQPPNAAQQDKHTGYQTAASQLGDIANLVPKVDLNRLVGGIQPWLTKVAQEGRVGGTFITPPFPIPEDMRMKLSPEEQRFIALTQDYADTVLRLRSGAQINEQEMVRMLDFLPTNISSPEAFRAKLGTAFDSVDRWMQAFYRGSKDFDYKVPEMSQRIHTARRVLKSNDRAYDDASVKTFLADPSNLSRINAEIAPYRPGAQP